MNLFSNKNKSCVKLTKLATILLLVSACKSDVEEKIVGKWEAAQLVECDDVVPIQTTLVNIEFLSNGKYIFNSTLNTREEGKYRMKYNYLYTVDKLKEKPVEKVVLVKYLTADSLVLEMNYKGKEQFLTFTRVGYVAPKADKKDVVAAVATATAVAATAMAKNAPNTEGVKSPIVETPIVETPTVVKAAEVVKVAVKTEEKKAETKKETPKAETLSPSEAYKKREAARKKGEEEKVKEADRKKLDAYKKREAKRKEDERDQKAEAKKRADAYKKRVKEEAKSKKK